MVENENDTNRCRHDMSNLRPSYATGGVAAGFAIVESKTHDGEYQCRLCARGIIHEYQTDSSSKQPAPVGVMEKC
jgi:hypothetical protein